MEKNLPLFSTKVLFPHRIITINGKVLPSCIQIRKIFSFRIKKNIYESFLYTFLLYTEQISLYVYTLKWNVQREMPIILAYLKLKSSSCRKYGTSPFLYMNQFNCSEMIVILIIVIMAMTMTKAVEMIMKIIMKNNNKQAQDQE